ncbi:hypothetical protein JXA12_02880 [Candidatus Woesearchaeota archaeon]|nr:hypothetical protein [Candidatus Woesearchaeota archaeon]
MELKEALSGVLGYDGGVSANTCPEVVGHCLEVITCQLAVLREHDDDKGLSRSLYRQATSVIGVKGYVLLRALGVEHPERVSVVVDEHVDYRSLAGVMGVAAWYAHR